MGIRDYLVVTLGKEILGPRSGPSEKMIAFVGNDPPDPSDEYVTGVLEPQGYRYSQTILLGQEALSSKQQVNRLDEGNVLDDQIEDDDSSFGGEPQEITPGLDPRSLPKSIGISFILSERPNPRISVCITWARYRRDGNSWQRIPMYFIQHDIDILKDIPSWSPPSDPGVKIYLKKVSVKGAFHVSLYLVNITPVKDDKKPKKPPTGEMIFQPQLRVVCEEGTQLLPIRDEEMQGEDEENLSLLYRDRYAMARGHLTGAVWYKVDPERESTNNTELPGPPFTWIDGAILPPAEREYFTRPSVRSDFLPCYNIEQASFVGPEGENLGELDASVLAQLYDSQELEQTMRPFIESYKNWIRSKKEAANKLEKRFALPAMKNLTHCEKTLERINEGLDMLKSCSSVRLSFCFMNQAMHQQSVWRNKQRPLKWRLFQIAFILQCIPSIVKEDHPDRTVCDLLWFPTAAGKTEAYLGLAAFTLAMRRLNARLGTSTEGGVTVISRYTLRLLTIQQFRRTLNLVTACEYLRIREWLPRGVNKIHRPWGSYAFSIGLWVGSDVTPNNLRNKRFFDQVKRRDQMNLGAVGELRGRQRLGISRHNIVSEVGEKTRPVKKPTQYIIMKLS